MPSAHFIRAGVCAAAVLCGVHAAHGGQPVSTAAPAGSNFTIFVRAVPIGSEQIGVERTDAGWTINSTGRIGPPLDIQTRRLQVRYSPDWKPLGLIVDAFSRGQQTVLQTVVTGTSARSTMTTNGTPTEKTDTIDAAAVLLPNPFFAPYEAVAARLRTAPAGATLAVYIAPTASVSIRVGESTVERIQTTNRLIEARRTQITLLQQGLPLDAEVWADEAGRLLRLSVPSQSLEVVREDISAVSARRVAVPRPGDEHVRVSANGFLLAATISKPAASTGAARLPAVVLAAGASPADRDETAFGIPIFGQLASALADEGFLVLRYDKRGTGQSGGRPESATVADYAEDLRTAVRYLSDRRDVDRRRIAVVGYGEGGWMGLVTASKENRVRALVLVATAATNGAELNLAQLQHSLARSDRPAAEQQATIALQKQIQDAAVTGKGWESVPPAMRRQAETAWFQSFLTFDPAKVMRDVDQPILIVQGLLDRQVDGSNADRLKEMAETRDGKVVETVKLAAVNHLLASAATGETDEYGTLPDKRVNPEVPAVIAKWLSGVMK